MANITKPKHGNAIHRRLDRARRSRQHGLCDAGANAELPARHHAGIQHDRLRAGAAHRGPDSSARAILSIPQPAPADDAVSLVAQPGE